MKFRVVKPIIGTYYFIALDTNNDDIVYATLYWVEDIIQYLQKYIQITLEEFEYILFQYNAIYESHEYKFLYLNDVQKVIDILNEKYITLIKLMEQ